jgi:hypothetical protein
MKNSKILILLVVITIVGIAQATSFKSYLTGSGKDKKSRTISHITAKNCDCIEDFGVELALMYALYREKLTKEGQSVLEKDSKGRTTRDIAKEMYKKTGHLDCQKMMLDCEEFEKVEREKLAKESK